MEDQVKSVCRIEEELITGEIPWKFSYGTAGFRDKAYKLERVVFRVGLLAVLRSRVKEAAIGVVITASHNPEEDNGVKVVDPLGEMLSQDWEAHATRLANASSSELQGVLLEIISSVGCDIAKPAHVVVARDTRPSGGKLVQLLEAAVKALSGKVSNHGVMTTPQLHYVVRCINTNGRFGQPSEDGYYNKLVSGFNKLLSPDARVGLKLDGANGVGALKVRQLMECFQNKSMLQIDIFNDGSSGSLNDKCGADYVKTAQTFPEGMAVLEGEKCVSYDGDADRIVYFFEEGGNFRLLDGDRIAALMAGYIKELLQVLQSDLSLGVVQTAYANGSSTSYLRDTLGVAVACTKTGVKHLHHKAVEFDVGIYFEANGHGTVLFSERAISTFRSFLEEGGASPEVVKAAEQLHALTELINQTVGDAISDMLTVEAILWHRKWHCRDWYQLYQDLPSRQLKVQVMDRSVVETTDFERRCASPAGLQGEIDDLVRSTSCGRAFIRPSGTEDVVRVYAEAEAQEEADWLAHQVKVKVHQLAGGVGELPQQ